jgi:hypothetical protein
MHQRLEQRPGGQPEDASDHGAAFRAEGEELGDAGRNKADDEERGGERERLLAPRLVEAEQRTQDRGEGGEEEAEQAARAKPLQRDLVPRRVV